MQPPTPVVDRSQLVEALRRSAGDAQASGGLRQVWANEQQPDQDDARPDQQEHGNPAHGGNVEKGGVAGQWLDRPAEASPDRKVNDLRCELRGCLVPWAG